MLLHPLDSEACCRRTGFFPRSIRTTTVAAEASTGRRLLGLDMGRCVLHREVCRTHREGRALPILPEDTDRELSSA